MSDISENLCDKTKDIWQSLSANTISDEHAREMITNISALFEILNDWISDSETSSEERTDTFAQ